MGRCRCCCARGLTCARGRAAPLLAAVGALWRIQDYRNAQGPREYAERVLWTPPAAAAGLGPLVQPDTSELLCEWDASRGCIVVSQAALRWTGAGGGMPPAPSRLPLRGPGVDLVAAAGGPPPTLPRRVGVVAGASGRPPPVVAPAATDPPSPGFHCGTSRLPSAGSHHAGAGRAAVTTAPALPWEAPSRVAGLR